jgi:hypothetical protein
MKAAQTEYVPEPDEADAAGATDWRPPPDVPDADTVAIRELLKTREFNPNVKPPPLRVIYSLGGITISTPANITTINAPIKAGKRAAIGAMAASATPHGEDADLLGFASANESGKALDWFDSEQSPDDFWYGVARALKRAGLEKLPAWLHAYCLTGLGAEKGWQAVLEALRMTSDQHGGIHSVLLDGAADFVKDVNDAAESNAFVATLHDLAIQYDAPIVGVIHFNPGSEKSRGHLGSQLERKAETNLALEKDNDGSTVIYSAKNRRADIPRTSAPRFRFDTAAGMHVTIPSRQSARDEAAREDLLCTARDVFGERPAMHYTDIVTGIQKALSLKERSAKDKIAGMKRLGVIQSAPAGLWTLCTPAEAK